MKITPNFPFAYMISAVEQISVCEQRNAAVVVMVLEGGGGHLSQICAGAFFLPALVYGASRYRAVV